ncbi:MAG TPA: hypothetical protein VNM24_12125 [Burkholderiales bacterium]|jgi:hypothetical protein|nr:hypothetical protein [Burkholderiales bacterium]
MKHKALFFSISAALAGLLWLAPVAGANDGADDLKVRFLEAVDRDLAQLAGTLPQLRYWHTRREGGWNAPGKSRSDWRLEYSTGLDTGGGARHEDRLVGDHACQIYIRVYGIKEFDRLPDDGPNSMIYGMDLGAHKVVATILTARPDSEEVVLRIAQIIRDRIDQLNNE